MSDSVDIEKCDASMAGLGSGSHLTSIGAIGVHTTQAKNVALSPAGDSENMEKRLLPSPSDLKFTDIFKAQS